MAPAYPTLDAPPEDVADLLLTSLARRHLSAAVVEPAEDAYALRLPGMRPESLPLAFDLGAALAARLGLLAGLDPWGAAAQAGRFKLQAGGAEAEIEVALSDGVEGLRAEARALAVAAASEGPADGPRRIGRYEVLQEIGRGGMGVVYKARHEAGGRAVALKLLHPQLARDREFAARFVREGRAASLADDPGIVSVSDFGSSDDGRAFLVMELLEGRTLEEVLDDGPLEVRRALLVARRIGRYEVLQEIGRGVVHRDLKPANVFLDPLDNVKIVDFGAAKLAFQEERRTKAGFSTVVGTPLYMAPEQAMGAETDERVDVYALGCMLYHMISGDAPFTGSTPMEVMLKHVSAPVPPVASPYGEVPDAVGDLVRQALAKRPEARFVGMGRLGEALDHALARLK